MTTDVRPRLPSPDLRHRRLLYRWIVATTAGEMLGLAAAALLLVLGASVAARMEGPGATVVMFACTALAGLVEGAILGALQARVIRDSLGVRPRHWIAATAFGATTAWFIGMAAGAHAPPAPVPPGTFVLASALLGAILGGVIGLAQWTVLSGRLERAGIWIGANAAAWSLGMVVAMTGAALAGEHTPPLVTAVTAIGTGAAAGMLVAIVTGVALGRLLLRMGR